MKILRTVDELIGLNWRTFDEILVAHEGGKLARLIYRRPPGSHPPAHDTPGVERLPDCLQVLVSDPTDAHILFAVKAALGGAAEEPGWLV